MKKPLLATLPFLFVSLAAAEPPTLSCFHDAVDPYLERTECVDATLIWHSTIDDPEPRDAPISVLELTFDPEWAGDEKHPSPPESVLLFGVGALDEVPLVFVIPSGTPVWEKSEEVERDGFGGISFPIMVPNGQGGERTREVVVLQSFEVYLDAVRLPRPFDDE